MRGVRKNRSWGLRNLAPVSGESGLSKVGTSSVKLGIR